jgi:hypothetical protein
MRSNHFIVLNGKLVSKSDTSAPPTHSKLSVLKSSQVVVKRESQMCSDEELKTRKL